MRSLKFELVEWQRGWQEFSQIPRTSLEVRKFKQKFFKGAAFNAAFPLSNLELPQLWRLKGVVETMSGECFEFEWVPDGRVTFSQLIQASRVHWGRAMQEAAGDPDAKSIHCEAFVL